MASMAGSSRAAASWTTHRPFPASGTDVKTSSHVSGRPMGSVVEVEVARRALLEPEPIVLRRLLEELRRALEDVAVLGLGLRRCVGVVLDHGLRLGRRVLHRGLVDRALDVPSDRLGFRLRLRLRLEDRLRLRLRLEDRLRLEIEVGLRPELDLGLRLRRLRGAADRTERLALLARDLAGIGSVAPLELEVLANGVVQQAHIGRSLEQGSERVVALSPHRAILSG